jgi:PAS domain S-box-containing protein
MIFPLRGQDGRLRPFLTRVAPLRDSEGRITRWFGTNTDISAQTEAEAAARAHEEELREIFDCAGDGIVITDGRGRVLQANHATLALTGYSLQELLAIPVDRLMRPEDHDRLEHARRQPADLAEWQILRRDGGWLDVEINTRRLSDGRRLAVVREITARRRQDANRATLAQSERQFRLLVAGVVDYALYMLDPTGMVISWNAGAEHIKGYRADEIVGRHFSTFYTDIDREGGAPQRALATALAQGRFDAEGWRVRKDGTRFWASVVIDPIHDEDGHHLGFAKITRDITERRDAQLDLQRAHERLAQAQKLEAVGQLTGGVAHDFNNLLMVVGGQAQLLRRALGEDSSALRRLDAIEAAARRGQDLTRHLLTFARRQRLQPISIELSARQDGLKELIAASVGSAVRVDFELPEDLWPIEVDLGELELALLNMASNARDAMPQGGVLSLSGRNASLTPTPDLDLTGDFVVLTLQDTGQGIPPDILAKIFEPFFTTKELGRGSGLGLSQVYGFAEQSGGRATVESELGRGARLSLYLPRALTQGAAGPSCEPASPAAGRGLSILVVEDNPEVADVAADLLRQLGHQPWVVVSADAALARLQLGDPPDLVFSDIVMAGQLNGLDLARRLRDEQPDLPVLLATGYSHAIERLDDSFAILPKPYQLADLERALAKLAPRTDAEDRDPAPAV